VDVGVDRQMTFFDEMRQESVARVGHIDRSRLSERSSWTAIVGLMGVTSKSVRLPVQKVQHGTGGGH